MFRGDPDPSFFQAPSAVHPLGPFVVTFHKSGGERDDRAGSCVMRRQRKIYSTARWKRLRLQILERDRWTCHYCRQPLSRTAPWGAQVDHVKPLCLGGSAFDPANLVACCVTCNTSRGAAVQRTLGKSHPSVRVGAIRV